MIFSDMLIGARYGAYTINSSGYSVPGATTALTGIRASVQRPDPKTLKWLLEGGHTEDAWCVDTTTALHTASESAGTPPDEVTIDGLVYVIIKSVQVRAVIPHYECVAVRKVAGKIS